MNAMTFIAQQLDGRRAAADRSAVQGDSHTEHLRVLLEEHGAASAKWLAEQIGLPTARIGALLKYDMKMGRVRFANGLYELTAGSQPAPKTVALERGQEIIQWVEVDEQLPDADLTVVVRTNGCSEPVWLGHWDGEVWRDTEGVEITVVRWAEMPGGGDA